MFLNLIKNTIKLQELDADLTERISQVTNVSLRIQHLLLNDASFAEEKTRILRLENTLKEHTILLEKISTEMASKYESIENMCRSVLPQVTELGNQPPVNTQHETPSSHASPLDNGRPHLPTINNPPIKVVNDFITVEECGTIKKHVLEELSGYNHSTSKSMYYGVHDYYFAKTTMKAKPMPPWLTPFMEKVRAHSPHSEHINCCHINVYEDGNDFLR